MIKRINEKKIEIDKLISKIGDKIVFILILGLMERKGLSLKEINVNNSSNTTQSFQYCHPSLI